MTQRITDSHLDGQINRLNDALGLPAEPWSDRPTDRANVGNIHLCGSNGYTQIYQMANAGGGVHHLYCGSKREVYDYLSAMNEGVRLAHAANTL